MKKIRQMFRSKLKRIKRGFEKRVYSYVDPGLQTIYVSESAYSTILREAKKGINTSTEFGGSLIGRIVNGNTFITHAVATGTNAGQYNARLITDYHFQSEIVKTVVDFNPELSYLGDWHVHPMYFPDLSSVDMDQASEILYHEKPNLKFLPLLLATINPMINEVMVLGFIIRRSSGYRIEKLRAQVVVVEDVWMEEKLGVTLAMEIPFYETLRKMNIRLNQTQGFKEKMIGSYISELVDAVLEQNVVIAREKDEYILTVKTEDAEFFIFLPDKFPFSKPDILNSDIEPLNRDEESLVWTPQTSLSDYFFHYVNKYRKSLSAADEKTVDKEESVTEKVIKFQPVVEDEIEFYRYYRIY